jgi:hypothetical protein
LRFAELKGAKLLTKLQTLFAEGAKLGRKLGREERIRKKDKEGKKMYENIFIGKVREQETWKKKRKHWGLACVAMFAIGIIFGWLIKGM